MVWYLQEPPIPGQPPELQEVLPVGQQEQPQHGELGALEELCDGLWIECVRARQDCLEVDLGADMSFGRPTDHPGSSFRPPELFEQDSLVHPAAPRQQLEVAVTLGRIGDPPDGRHDRRHQLVAARQRARVVALGEMVDAGAILTSLDELLSRG